MVVFRSSLETNDLSRWRDRVRSISSGPSLIPADVKPDVWREVTGGLLHSYALDVTYNPRGQTESQTYVIHPQALVHKHSVTYLVATVKDYEQALQFALHRFSRVERSTSAYFSLPGFDVDEYISGGAFGFKESDEKVELHALINPELRIRLIETALTTGQEIGEPDENGWSTFMAIVNDEQAMLWWLQSQGATIKVLEPSRWRESLRNQAQQLIEWYGTGEAMIEITPLNRA
ncbi:MAG: WYL domain-containing protein, partial [Natronospirillum sp.]